MRTDHIARVCHEPLKPLAPAGLVPPLDLNGRESPLQPMGGLTSGAGQSTGENLYNAPRDYADDLAAKETEQKSMDAERNQAFGPQQEKNDGEGYEAGKAGRYEDHLAKEATGDGQAYEGSQR